MSNSAYCLFGTPFGVLSGPAFEIFQVVGERTSSSVNAAYVGGEVVLHSVHFNPLLPTRCRGAERHSQTGWEAAQQDTGGNRRALIVHKPGIAVGKSLCNLQHGLARLGL